MWQRRTRLIAGLVFAAYVVPHFINHGLGLVSIEAMDAMRRAMRLVWGGWPGGLLLTTSLLVHFALGLASLYRRSTLRMPPWEAVQIGFGLVIVPLILAHVAGTLVAAQLLDFEPSYPYVVAALWIAEPHKGLQQAIVLVAVWIHLSVGVHFWLRLRAGYRRLAPVLFAVAVLVPTLALLGFAQAGRELDRVVAADPGFLARIFAPVQADPEMRAILALVEPNGVVVFFILVALVLAGRVVRSWLRNRRGVYRLTLPDGRRITASLGETVLEALRVAGIPHASVCGGRGRCTTCRVHVGSAVDHLAPPNEIEAKALARIGAEPGVRLACQTRPRRDLAIVPLLKPNATARDANRPGGIQGREQEVAVMFVDLRGSTKLGEKRLPFDVLFVLNQFFAEMSAALRETGGHYAQFSGDGLMALYGLGGRIETGCRDAVNGAAAMMARLDRLNARLGRELAEPLRMGIGIHSGEAIVGTMGPPTAQNFSAIGDNVNIAARLESLTKELGCTLVISEAAAGRAGLALDGGSRREVAVRGRDQPIAVYAVADPRRLVPAPKPEPGPRL